MLQRVPLELYSRFRNIGAVVMPMLSSIASMRLGLPSVVSKAEHNVTQVT